MRVITWNIHGAKSDSLVWKFLLEMNPDIILLQEVGSIPERIKEVYDILSRVAIYKTGRPQKFSTVVLTNGKIIGEIPLSSDRVWVNSELDFFKGNLISCIIQLPNQEPINVISVYSPAWPVDKERLNGIDVSQVKLKLNPDVWVTEIIWSALKTMVSGNENWIVGGDYNSSETFDKEWQDKNGIKFGIRSYGNREILDRMVEIGFTECLRTFNNDKIIPTFKHSSSEIAHQMDHLFVTNNVFSRLDKCVVGEHSIIFDRALSDHLPIIADFSEH
jgi:exonuclease III